MHESRKTGKYNCAMATPAFAVASKGMWSGKSRLNLTEPPGPEEIYECDSTMEVRVCEGYAVIDYVWEHDGEPQTGTIVLAVRNGAATAGWIDSWHQNVAVMLLEGSEADTYSVQGSYPTSHWGTWGWRIEFEYIEEELRMLMTNVSPEGKEQWAVDARFKRAS
jgi:hypothetical protein